MIKLEINLKDNDYYTSEALKTIRTNVLFCGEDVKTIAITSTIPGEGKSSVSFELARSLAEAGKKVIFIDADLRKLAIVGRYKIKQAIKGFTHYLSGQNVIGEVLQNTNIENLHMIIAGPVPPNPAELLGGKKFKVVIQALRDTYDYVIIDTPPLGSVIDCAIVAKECDGAILVIEDNKISYKFAQKVKEQLEKTGCTILGVVMNKVKVSKDDYYKKYYGE